MSRLLFSVPLALACTGEESTVLDDTGPADTGPAAEECPEAPTPLVDLPADDALHEEDVEWWYWTGHLQDEEGRWYGMEQAFFVFQMESYRASMAHVALTDLDTSTFTYEIFYVHDEVPEARTDGFSLDVVGQTATGGGGADTLHGLVGKTGFDLTLTDPGDAVLQHGDGYHDYDVGGYTWYYSRPRMEVVGTVTVDGEQRAVTGEAWFDHQWGALGEVAASGWDWFALQLDDGRDIMLFLTAGDGLVGGSIRDGDCVTEIDPATLSVTGTDDWISPETGCSYSQSWTIEIAGETFTVTSQLPEQELVNIANTYWEGVALVSGDQTGRAYIELAGQCD